jgi:hypothetical protein
MKPRHITGTMVPLDIRDLNGTPSTCYVLRKKEIGRFRLRNNLNLCFTSSNILSIECLFGVIRNIPASRSLLKFNEKQLFPLLIITIKPHRCDIKI